MQRLVIDTLAIQRATLEVDGDTAVFTRASLVAQRIQVQPMTPEDGNVRTTPGGIIVPAGVIGATTTDLERLIGATPDNRHLPTRAGRPIDLSAIRAEQPGLVFPDEGAIHAALPPKLRQLPVPAAPTGRVILATTADLTAIVGRDRKG